MVAVGPGIHDPQRRKADRQQRWERLEQVEQGERSGERPAHGMAPRHAAKGLDVPRRPLQAGRASHENREEPPAVVALVHSVPGLACRQRLGLACPLGGVARGAWGRRLGGQLTGRHQCVGAS